MPQRLIGILQITTLALLMSACSTTGGENVPEQSAEDVSEPSAVCDVAEGVSWGDVVPLREVEDELGKYCQTTIAPDADALVIDPEVVDSASLEEFGFTVDDAEALLPQTVEFFAEEVLDSALLDRLSESTWNEWLEANGERFDLSVFDFAWSDEENVFLDAENIVFTNTLPPTIRDGGARTDITTIDVTGVRAVEGGSGDEVLLLDFYAEVHYRVSDDSAVEYMIQQSASDGEVLDRETLIATRPELKLDDGEENIIVTRVSYTVGYGNDGLITGYLYNYETAPSAFPIE